MSLQPGHTLSHYEILEPIGKGGMGEVYRARDSKLGRDVAIKVLPEEFSTDKQRLDRFEREAKLLAQLNHSNIATLHGLEESMGGSSSSWSSSKVRRWRRGSRRAHFPLMKPPALHSDRRRSRSSSRETDHSP